jgi:hypothetical protein
MVVISRRVTQGEADLPRLEALATGTINSNRAGASSPRLHNLNTLYFDPNIADSDN